MIASRRWQDWTAAAIGVVVAVSPLFIAGSASSNEAWAAYFMGGLIFLVAAGKLLWPSFGFADMVQVVLGAILFVSPWVIGFTAAASMSWMAWILGIALVVVAGSNFLSSQTMQRPSPTT